MLIRPLIITTVAQIRKNLARCEASAIRRNATIFQEPGGLSPDTQYSEAGKITNRTLRTSKPSAIAEFHFQDIIYGYM